MQEAQRTKQIVQNLLSFARQMPPQRNAVQLNVILRRTIQLRSGEGEGLWRRVSHLSRNGNLYPTHGLGPVANYMGINRGDRLDYMVSLSSPQKGLDAYRSAHVPQGDAKWKERYRCGDLNTSLLKTANGLTILLQHDVSNARPYTGRANPPSSPGRGNGPVAWAFLLPGVLGLGGLAWGARRRAWLSRLSLIALVGLVTMLGTTACNPRYYYFNHGPPNNLPTPSGSYTVTVTGQSSNGITAITQNTTMVLTVQ